MDGKELNVRQIKMNVNSTLQFVTALPTQFVKTQMEPTHVTVNLATRKTTKTNVKVSIFEVPQANIDSHFRQF